MTVFLLNEPRGRQTRAVDLGIARPRTGRLKRSASPTSVRPSTDVTKNSDVDK